MKDELSFLGPGELDPVRPSSAGPSPTEGERTKGKAKRLKPKKAYSSGKNKDQASKKGRPDQGRIDVEA